MAQAAKTKKVFDNRYEILDIVGRGVESVVYRAQNITAPHQEVALKVLLQKKEAKSSSERLRKEALALSSARHKYVVRLFDFQSLGDLCYLSMEFAPGSDLRKYLSTRGHVLQPAQAERYLSQMAEALAFCHKAGIVHRDLKPDNILVMSDTEVRLGDFSTAMLPGETSNLEELQRGVGTLDYMAPEVLQGGSFDVRGDIYALGVTFYELLSGQHPFADAPLLQQVDVRRDGRFPNLRDVAPHVPTTLAELIMKTLRFSPADRYQDADELVRALNPGKSRGNLKLQKTTPPARTTPKGAEVVTASETTPAPASTAVVAQHSDVPTTSPQITRETSPDSASHTSHDSATLGLKQTTANADSKAGHVATNEMQSGSDVNVVSGSAETQVPTRERKKTGMVDLDPTERATARLPTEQIDRDFISKVRDEAIAAAASVNTPTENSETESLEVTGKPGSPRLLRKLLVLAFTTCAIATVAGLFLADSNQTAPRVPVLFNNEAKTTKTTAKSTTPIKPAEVVDIGEFPALAAGVYHGAMRNVAPNTNAPIALVAMPEHGKFVLSIGLPGWTGSVVTLKEGAERDAPIRVSSNGVVFDLYGRVKNGQVLGEFVNLVTGEEGTWFARPSPTNRNVQR